jgi:membrane protein YqaA with SNARE-associated domain
MELIGLFFSGLTSATLLPGSSEAVLTALLVSGEQSLIALIIAASIGNILGSLINWWMGRYLIRFQDRKWFPATPAQIAKSRIWFQKFGIWSLLLAWLPIVGDPLTVIAGVLQVRLIPFLILVSIGKIARYSFITFIFLVYAS